jgi:hypothetical protein
MVIGIFIYVYYYYAITGDVYGNAPKLKQEENKEHNNSDSKFY